MIRLDHSLPPMTAMRKGLVELSQNKLKIDDIKIVGFRQTEIEKVGQVRFGVIPNHQVYKGEITRDYHRVDIQDIVRQKVGSVLRGDFQTLTTNMVALSEALHTGYGIGMSPEYLMPGDSDYLAGKIEILFINSPTVYGKATFDFIEHKLDIAEELPYERVAMFEV